MLDADKQAAEQFEREMKGHAAVWDARPRFHQEGGRAARRGAEWRSTEGPCARPSHLDHTIAHYGVQQTRCTAITWLMSAEGHELTTSLEVTCPVSSAADIGRREHFDMYTSRRLEPSDEHD